MPPPSPPRAPFTYGPRPMVSLKLVALPARQSSCASVYTTAAEYVDARDFLPHACHRVPDWSSWPPHAVENRMPRTALAPHTGASTAAVDSRLEPTNFGDRIWS